MYAVFEGFALLILLAASATYALVTLAPAFVASQRRRVVLLLVSRELPAFARALGRRLAPPPVRHLSRHCGGCRENACTSRKP